ncbi:DUF6461 domain-containing protein [Nonomuraea wenchangensis]
MNAFIAYTSTIRSVFDMPACLTWAKGRTMQEFVTHLGGESEQLSEGTFEELYDAYELEPGEGIVLFSQEGDWIVAVEFTRYKGLDPDVLRRLSDSGQALAFGWSVELDATLSYAVDGVIEMSFDPVRQGTAAFEADCVSWSGAYGVTSEQWRQDWQAAAFAIAEHMTGLHLDQGWRNRRHLILRIEDEHEEEPLARPPLKLRPDMRELISRYPRVAAIAADPPNDDFVELTLIAAELAVRTAGLSGPLVENALTAIRSGTRGARASALRETLVGLGEDLRRQAAQVTPDQANIHHPDIGSEWGRLLMKRQAVEALVAPLEQDPYPGFLTAVRRAQEVTAPTRKQDDGHRLAKVLETLGFYVFNGVNAL